MKTYWLSTVRMTVRATVDRHGRIVDAAPIIGRFVGQPFGNLERWLRRQGGYIKTKLEDPTP